MSDNGRAMKPIGEYQHFCEGMTVEDYLADDPPGVLLLASALKGLASARGAPGSTMNRLNLGDDPSRLVPSEVSRADAYSVLPLLSRSGERDGRLVIGCGTTCDIFIDDTSISREHAWVERRDEAYFLGDLQSVTGVRVNDTHLKPRDECPLNTGDRVELGRVELMFLSPLEFYNFVQRFLG